MIINKDFSSPGRRSHKPAASLDSFLIHPAWSVKLFCWPCGAFFVLPVCSIFTAVLTGFISNMFSHPCHFQRCELLSSGMAARGWAADSGVAFACERVVRGCAVFSVMSISFSRTCPLMSSSQMEISWSSMSHHWPTYMWKSAKMNHLYDFIHQGGTRLHLSARVSLKPQPGSAGTLQSKASDKSLPLSYVLVYVGWALIYEKWRVCNVYCASTALQFHTKNWQLEPCRLHRAQG